MKVFRAISMLRIDYLQSALHIVASGGVNTMTNDNLKESGQADQFDDEAVMENAVIKGMRPSEYRKRRQKLLVLKIARLAVQIGALALLWKWVVIGIAYCPFAVPFIYCRICPVIDCPGIWLIRIVGWGLIPLTLIGGRIFCGWLCPIGWLNDMLAKLPKFNMAKTRHRITVDRALSITKFIVLMLVLILIFVYDNPRIFRPEELVRTNVLSWDIFTMTLAMAPFTYFIRLGFFLVGLVAALFIARAWCRYLCPLGALLGIGNKICAVGLTTDNTKCTSCNVCRRHCSMNAMPREVNCINAYECTLQCPYDAIKFRVRWLLQKHAHSSDGGERE